MFFCPPPLVTDTPSRLTKWFLFLPLLKWVGFMQLFTTKKMTNTFLDPVLPLNI